MEGRKATWVWSESARTVVYVAALYATPPTLIVRQLLRAGLERSIFRASTSTKASGRTIRGKASAYAYFMAELDSKGPGPRTCSTGRDSSFRLTGRSIRESGKRGKEREWASPSGPTAIDTRASSEWIDLMDVGSSITATEMSTMESGRMVAATAVAIANFPAEMTIRQAL